MSWKRVLIAASVAALVVTALFGRILYSQHATSSRFTELLSELRERFGAVTARGLAEPETESSANGASHLYVAEDSESAWDLDVWALDGPELRAWTPQEWSEAERVLQANESSLVQIEAALRAPRIDMRLDWSRGVDMTLPSVGAVVTAVKLLHLRAIVRAFRQGDVSGAVADVGAILRLSEAPSRQSMRTCALRFYVRQMATALLRLIAVAPGFPAESTRRQLDSDLRRAEEDSSILGALRGATAFGVCVVDKWVAGEEFNPELPTSETARMASTLSRWTERAAAYEAGIGFLLMMERAMAAESGLAAWEAQERFGALRREYNDARYPYLLTRVSCSIPERVGGERLRGLAAVRVAKAGLAILAHHERTGEWPQGMEQALGAVVIDPYTGQPLSYVRNAEGAVVEAAVPMSAAIREDPEVRRDLAIAWRFYDRVR